MLVYQGGLALANVFEVNEHQYAAAGREAKRLLQGSFFECATFARGLGVAGVIVRTGACNKAGDIINEDWTGDLDSQPFSEQFKIVEAN